MKRLLEWLLGRLPIGWLQLQHNRSRLVAAVGGVTFANILIFMQLGFMNALFNTSVLTHRRLVADVVVTSSDFRTLREANPFPRRRLYQLLRVPGVAEVTPVYLATLLWTDPVSGDTTNFRVVGIEPDKCVFVDPELQSQIYGLREPDTALVDSRMRDFPAAMRAAMSSHRDYPIETLGRQLLVRGFFSQGASFDVDGSLIVSDQTFFRLFPARSAATPSLGLVRCEANASLGPIVDRMTRVFPERDVVAWTKSDFVAEEQRYQARQSPIGFVFGFGVAMGIVVGLVIVYQVLATDVQDHLSEYATFKAIGYPSKFFLGIVFEEALCLSLLGFVPGLIVASGLYVVAANATSLPITMPWTRPVLVLALTAAMCSASGAIATQRLRSADPAELF